MGSPVKSQLSQLGSPCKQTSKIIARYACFPMATDMGEPFRPASAVDLGYLISEGRGKDFSIEFCIPCTIFGMQVTKQPHERKSKMAAL